MANQQGKIGKLLSKHSETSKRKRESDDEEEGSRKRPKHNYRCPKYEKRQTLCEKDPRYHEFTKCPLCKKLVCSACIMIGDKAHEYCSTCTKSVCNNCKTRCTKCTDYHCKQCNRYDGGKCKCCIVSQMNEAIVLLESYTQYCT
jgi:hypothetical protein